jgi:hypothetical protein
VHRLSTLLTEDTVTATALGVLSVLDSLAASTALQFLMELAQRLEIIPESALVRLDIRSISIYPNAFAMCRLNMQ